MAALWPGHFASTSSALHALQPDVVSLLLLYCCFCFGGGGGGEWCAHVCFFLSVFVRCICARSLPGFIGYVIAGTVLGPAGLNIITVRRHMHALAPSLLHSFLHSFTPELLHSLLHSLRLWLYEMCFSPLSLDLCPLASHWCKSQPLASLVFSLYSSRLAWR